MGICRKLEDIRQDLALLGEHGKANGFFNNVENANKLDGLVEDVRDAIMDYQVWIQSINIFLILKLLVDIIAAGLIPQGWHAYSSSHSVAFFLQA